MRKLTGYIGLAIGVITLVLGIGSPAFAHNAMASANCSKVSWNATNYSPNQTNTIVVTIDGVQVYSDLNFGTSDSGSRPNGAGWSQAVDHTWSVVVGAPGTQFDFSFSGTQVACQPPEVTTTTLPPTTTTVPPTTTTEPPGTTVPGTTVPVPEVVTSAPQFVDPVCHDVNAGVFVADTVGVEYNISGEIAPGSTVTVTAVASAGYVIAPGSETVWTHTFTTIDPNCNAIPTTSVDVPATVPGLPATGSGSSLTLTVIAVTLIGIGAVLLRLSYKPIK